MSSVTTTAVDILGADDVSRAVTRISHEIVERNPSLESVVIVGMQTGGTWIAQRLCESVNRIVEGATVPPWCNRYLSLPR